MAVDDDPEAARKTLKGAPGIGNEAHVRSILDTLPDALIVIDPLGVIQCFSPVAERRFGWTAAEAIGRNVEFLMPKPHSAAHDGYLELYRRTGEKRIIGTGRIVVAARKDGSTFPMEIAVVETLSEGKPFFAGFVRDLTEGQDIDDGLQAPQTELTEISRLNALGELASTLAHELNQPLTAIANYLTGARRILSRPELDVPRVDAALEKAVNQALRAGRIIRRLRDFVAGGKSEAEIVGLAKLIEEASALALVGIEQHSFRVSYQLDSSVDLVLADRVQIQQVVVNLIRNAVDAMASSPRQELMIRTDPADVEGFTRVSVSDTGPGVSPELAAHLFQTLMSAKAGAGVGLWISRTIIEAHGGRIWVEANEAGGATFQFLLRAVSPEDVDNAR